MGKLMAKTPDGEYNRITFRDKYNCVQVYSEYTETEVINRLAKLEDKIEEGTIMELPCKLGDTFWVINKTKYGFPFVMDIKVEWFELHNGCFYVGNYNCFAVKAWRTDNLFLTREDAEKKLKEL